MILPPPAFDPESFIVENLRLVAVPGLPEIRIYTAHPGSGLGRLTQLVSGKAATPYWAYPWAGGTALARHILDHSEIVCGRDVLDLGAGSGIVGIAAKLSGARTVTAAESDPYGRVAIALNADRNGVELTVAEGEVTHAPPPEVDLILAGDVFYDRQVSRQMLAYLDACLANGIDVLIGDPHRTHLPRPRLRHIADYAVPDFGSPGGAPVASAVFAMEARPLTG